MCTMVGSVMRCGLFTFSFPLSVLFPFFLLLFLLLLVLCRNTHPFLIVAPLKCKTDLLLE